MMNKGEFSNDLMLSIPQAVEESVTKFQTHDATFNDEYLRVKDGVRTQSEPLSPIKSGDQLSLSDLDMVKVIGKGSIGVVQLVQHKRTGQFFALKVIPLNFDKANCKAVAQGLEILISLQCSYLVTSYHPFYDNGSISLILEYMDGGSLADFLKSVKVIPESYLSAIIKQVLQGLFYLHHKRHIIHRDLKPSNLLINHRGEVKITDFSLCAILTNISGLTNTFVGTYNYMSPERIVGNKYGIKSDIWSLGLIVFECATGKLPYLPPCQDETWTSVFELMEAIVDQPPPALPSGNFSHELSSFISTCLQKDPNSRSSAKELLEHPFLNKYNYLKINLAPYFTDAGSPLAALGNLSDTCVASSAATDYDVVIKYRRGDINNDDFISHLHAALARREISVHEDFDEVDAVPKCRVLIIFLTSTYIPSNLLNILEHQRKEPQVVYPFFYGITPSDWIIKIKNYARLFLQDEPDRWQAALKELTQMPGYTLTDKSESEVIDEIVRDALEVLCSNDKDNMIGMEIQIKEILSLLCIESPDVRNIGIWGMVGVGKTAIAEEIFHIISFQYETCVFLKDLHRKVEVKGHDAVREYFLSKVLEVEPHVIRISDIKTSFLRSRLQRKRVLIILDDVIDYRDVETFLGNLNYFGPGSRIILTSRNRHIFVQCKIDHVYEVTPLDISSSLLLLDCDTFQSVLSPEVYRKLSLEVVKFSNGNPKVLQFFSKSNAEWDRLSVSQDVQKTSPVYIPGILERSCCGLDENERSIFLDVACFFRRMDTDYVAMLLDGCGFSAHVGFRSLVDKSLLTISHNMVEMLRFIQATGREIVRQESADRPGDRSRLWNPEDIRDVFIDNTGTSTIEGIFLDMSNLKFDANPNAFEKMCNLRLLKFYFSKVVENHGVSLPQGLEYLPSKLRLLHWEYYPLSSLPKCFDPKNLVELNLPSSCAKKLWKGKKSLEKLKKMRLSYSNELTKIPRLSNAPNLKHIDLEGCNSLVSISQSISSLKKLVFLNLKDCSKLESVPSMVELESLEVLNLSGCSKLDNFPEISPNVKELYMGGTMIQEIPSSIKNLVLLEKLDLENSRHLENLPTSICKLKHLETLNLSGCSSLKRFPDLSRRMKCLRFLDLSRTAIKELPSSISYLTALEELRLVDCTNLLRFPDNTWSLRFNVEFRQIDTEKFSRLWNRFGWLKKVQIS